MAAIILTLIAVTAVSAGDVKIVSASFQKDGSNWTVNVKLHHGDTGWDHYADSWRIVDEKGTLLAERVLHHPHVDEQPFTRSLFGVTMPDGTAIVFIEAHDKVHGWTPDRLKVDLGKAVGGRLRVEAKQ
jgi:hypothetical protein